MGLRCRLGFHGPRKYKSGYINTLVDPTVAGRCMSCGEPITIPLRKLLLRQQKYGNSVFLEEGT